MSKASKKEKNSSSGEKSDSPKRPAVVTSALHADQAHAKKFKKTAIIVAVLFVIFILIPTVVGGVMFWKSMQAQAVVDQQKAEARAKAEEEARIAQKLKLKQEQEEVARAIEEERLKLEEAERRLKEAERKAKIRGGVFVETEPSEATVTVGEQVVISPATIASLTYGKHTILIEKPKFESVQKEVEIKEDGIVELGLVKLVRGTGQVTVVSEPTGANVFRGGKQIGVTPLVLKKQLTGKIRFSLTSSGYLPTSAEGEVVVSPDLQLKVILEKRPGPVAGESWENDIGMEFNPVKGLPVLFAIHETNVKDFNLFVEETGYQPVGKMRSLKDGKWGYHGHEWQNPGFEQDENHPLVGVSWQDAKAFCKWLTERDREMEILSENQSYRLPKDSEWSIAVGLKEDSEGYPIDKNGVVENQYPWGNQWPPDNIFGNYAGREVQSAGWNKKWEIISVYRDPHPRTSRVGSYRRGRNGLYDMSGNVWEWSEDLYESASNWRVLRGASWATNKQDDLLLSRREFYPPESRFSMLGFRCVVEY